MRLPRRKTVLYGMLACAVFIGIGIWGGIRYAKSRFFRDTPNALSFEGKRFPVPFVWDTDKFEDYVEPHAAILVPVRVPGIEKEFLMQFDTGSPSTFLRSGCMASLADQGLEFELYEEDEMTRVRHFELNIAQNKVILKGGWIRPRNISIDWAPDALNIIGTIGADFIDQQVCAIDFPSRTIHIFEQRPESLKSLGTFSPFDFKGRRIMLPATIENANVELLYDSGCSSFGLLTSKYYFERFADPEAKAIHFNANRFGDLIPIHHQPTNIVATLGNVKLPLKRVSYVEQYAGLQSVFGRFFGGGFIGNKSLTESTLILDVKAEEFLVLPRALAEVTTPADSPSEAAVPTH